MNYIKKVKPNIFSGKFVEHIELKQGLNIIAGNNGTGKTQFLKFIQANITNNSLVEKEQNAAISVASFNPKRNAQKQQAEQIQRLVQRDENSETNALNAFLNQQIQDENFQTIRPIPEYLIHSAGKLVDSEGKTREDAAKVVCAEYQEVLNKVFDYQIGFTWISSGRNHNFTITKSGNVLQMQQLSSGENAIISLMFAIFYTRNNADVYLIDEPEVHLNWQLEERLFNFLNWFAITYKKQLVVATHSRICFVDPYSKSTQFLLWQGGVIKVVEKPDSELVIALSGDIVKIISGITSLEKIVYAEDDAHFRVLKKIADIQGASIEVVKLTNSVNVKQQSKAFKNLSIGNVFFLIDNDNSKLLPGELTEHHSGFIQLEKYCIENYFLNRDILSEIDCNNPKKDIAQEIFQSIKEVNQQNFAPVKTLLLDKTSVTEVLLDRLDASVFLKSLSAKLGFPDKYDLMDAYVLEVNRQGKLRDIFPEIISKFF